MEQLSPELRVIAQAILHSHASSKEEISELKRDLRTLQKDVGQLKRNTEEALLLIKGVMEILKQHMAFPEKKAEAFAATKERVTSSSKKKKKKKKNENENEEKK